jgi:uncharacterized protein (DUF736 family)
MANIGSFKKVGNDFQGEIITLSLQAKGVRIVAEANRSNDNAPSHRIYVGRAEIGAAWSKRSEEGRDYLSLKLDDPSFNAPIYANLFDEEAAKATPSCGRGRARTATKSAPQAPSGPPGGALRGWPEAAYDLLSRATLLSRSPGSTPKASAICPSTVTLADTSPRSMAPT